MFSLKKKVIAIYNYFCKALVSSHIAIHSVVPLIDIKVPGYMVSSVACYGIHWDHGSTALVCRQML